MTIHDWATEDLQASATAGTATDRMLRKLDKRTRGMGSSLIAPVVQGTDAAIEQINALKQVIGDYVVKKQDPAAKPASSVSAYLPFILIGAAVLWWFWKRKRHA